MVAQWSEQHPGEVEGPGNIFFIVTEDLMKLNETFQKAAGDGFVMKFPFFCLNQFQFKGIIDIEK